MTYTTPELVTYGKVENLTNGGGPGAFWESATGKNVYRVGFY